ncbi:two-component system OmpR family sensor kinase [Sediminihabitans luteus]|uniref:histidine kinase n=1 Tax=Sediminihabitans luteus TaxID=1138585 RepID=A0A2M9CE23_9CELL|nr:HAMP domain-containing sensor histidine kinase [Sediminihabitans luteus]PJJ70186.1 two-component system OmpR family sensor kinase [Sediminihabitans luteus]GII97657.1 two-component sensor histidine kinase [Sediminihabitans luteus]
MTAPGPPPPPPPPPPYGRPVGPPWSWWQRITLRARLVAITSLVLAAGLGVAALVTTTVVSNYLVGQVDASLTETAQRVDGLGVGQLQQAAGVLPSDYYILTRSADGESYPLVQSSTESAYGVPDIPAMSTQEIEAASGEPFTVSSRTGADQHPTTPTDWRVITLPLQSSLTGQTVGSAFVALPLADIHQTLQILVRTLAAAALAIVTLGAVVAHLAVQRSLRPLREIETTAAGIAAGDLSRRVRPAPETTEVGSLAESLNAMLAQIERAFEAQEASEARMRRFVSDASHELRTPVAAIRGYGELYRMGALQEPEHVADTMARIEDSARRMGMLVQDLLSLARLDEGRPVRRDRVDLGRLARDAAQDLHALDPSRTVDVVGPDGGDVPGDVVVVGDEDRLRQVMTNLIGNVARHTPSGTAAEIVLAPATASDGAPAVRVEVRDHGPGMGPEESARIFERFYRVDSSRTRESGGSGLGMAIVAAIVAAHGGSVGVSATDGGGLTVGVLLPVDRYDGGSSPRAASDRT